MSNSGDENLESNLKVGLKLDSTQIRQDLRTVRELMDQTFQREGDRLPATPMRTPTVGGISSEPVGYPPDLSTAKVGNVVDYAKTALQSSRGSMPFLYAEDKMRTMDALNSGFTDAERSMLFRDLEQAGSTKTGPLRALTKDLPTRMTSRDQIAGFERVSAEFQFGMGRGSLGAGAGGFQMSAMHDVVQQGFKDLAESMGKSADLEVLSNEMSRRRMDFKMSNRIDGQNQYVIGEVKTGRAGSADITQFMRYMRDQLEKYMEQNQGFPTSPEMFKGFVAAPGFKRGTTETMYDEWRESITHAGTRGFGEAPEWLRDPSKFVNFVNMSGMYTPEMMTAAYNQDKPAMRGAFQQYLSSTAGAQLKGEMMGRVNPLQDPVAQRKLEIWSAYSEDILGARTMSDEENAFMGNIRGNPAKVSRYLRIEKGFTADEVEDFMDVAQGGDWGDIQQWIQSTEIVTPDLTPSDPRTISAQKKGRKREERYRELYPMTGYKSVLDRYLGGGRKKDIEKQRSNFMAMYGLGSHFDDRFTDVSRTENAYFWGSTYAKPQQLTGKISSKLGTKLQATDFALWEGGFNLEQGGGFSSYNLDRDYGANWRKAILQDPRLSTEIVSAQRKVDNFRGEMTATEIMNRVGETIDVTISEYQRRGKSPEEITRKRAELLLTGVNTYGGFLTFLSQVSGSGLFGMTRDQLQDQITDQSPFIQMLGTTYDQAKQTSTVFIERFREMISQQASDPESNFYTIKELIEDLKFLNEATLNMSIGTHMQVWLPLNTG